ncbi:MAG TPA: DNA-directed RNA polymerase subunit omega [Clostridiales bacterium]|nr:DNA-directed RNA polymerase subunit omega [Clostridiales bacterium]
MSKYGFNPELTTLLNGEHGERISRYSLVSATAKLAREIADDAGRRKEILTEKPVSMALEKLLDKEYVIEEPDEIKNL